MSKIHCSATQKNLELLIDIISAGHGGRQVPPPQTQLKGQHSDKAEADRPVNITPNSKTLRKKKTLSGLLLDN